MRLADSHCHLTDRSFQDDLSEVLGRARGAGVGRIVTISTDVDDAEAARRLAEEHDDIWCTSGVHPHEADRASAGFAAIRELASHPRCVAIGETGLDYHYENAPREAQRRSFSRHVELAAQLELPLIVHSRSAVADTEAVVGECAGGVVGVLHCFTGPAGLLEAALEAGWFVSFTGIATFRSFDSELAAGVPADRYMIETDAPYLAPVPARGRRNEPSLLRHVAAALAVHRGESAADVASASWTNSERFYGLGGAGVAPAS